MLRVPSGQLEPYLLGIIDVDREQCLSFQALDEGSEPYEVLLRNMSL